MIQETGPNHPTSLYIYTDQNSYEALARIDKRGSEEQEIRYFHTDLNGCPEELTDAEGKILWECSYQLWGKRIHEIEHIPIQQNLRYQGQYLDRETGLHYNTFRYYDPDIGRFTQPDPIGLAGGFNLYQYAPNGLTWIDPWGLRQTFCGRPQNRGVRHSSRKKAKEAAAHAHKGKKRPPPTKRPPQNATTSQLERWRRKKNRYNQQQDYKRPESHPNSKHPEPHFHEGQKPDIHTSAKGRETNTHHSF